MDIVGAILMVTCVVLFGVFVLRIRRGRKR